MGKEEETTGLAGAADTGGKKPPIQQVQQGQRGKRRPTQQVQCSKFKFAFK